MKNNKPNKLILYPQKLTPPKDYVPTDDQDTKSLKINCLFYWKKHRFPDCCDFHRRRVLDRNLNTDAWNNSGEHLFKAITYTLFFVDKATKNEEGLANSKTYISSILFSFGTQSPIVNKYIEWTIAILKNRKSVDESFLKSIIDYLASFDGSNSATFQQLAEAEQAFNKWMGSLPEDLIPEEVQQHLSLVFFNGIIKSLIEEDELNAVRRLELNSAAQFLEYLSKMTKSILYEIWKSIAKGDVNDTIKEASIIDQNKTVTEINLTFENYSDQERNYLTIIQQWGNIVSNFIHREIERKKSLTGYSEQKQTVIPIEQKIILQKQKAILRKHRAILKEQKAISQEQKVIPETTIKVNQRSKPSFPELFRDPSYYHNFMDLLTRHHLIDQDLNWIDEDKNKMIGLFWGLLKVKKDGRSIFISGPPKPTPYAREIFKHFKINKRVLCSERYLTEYQKHVKVTNRIKDQFTKDLELHLFPNNKPSS